LTRNPNGFLFHRYLVTAQISLIIGLELYRRYRERKRLTFWRLGLRIDEDFDFGRTPQQTMFSDNVGIALHSSDAGTKKTTLSIGIESYTIGFAAVKMKPGRIMRRRITRVEPLSVE
jgi:hypothetical protein